MLFPIALALHLLSLALLAAGGVGGLFLHVALKRAVPAQPQQAAALGRMGAAFGMVATGAAVLMLLSGILLLKSRGWADVGHPWLSVKLALYVALMLNGILVAKPTGARLGAGLAACARGAAPADGEAVLGPLARMGRFHLVQTAGLVGLILLGVFGPR